MFLPVCHECSYGEVKDEQSFCSREAVYSRLSRCLQKKALESFLEQESVNKIPSKIASNQ
jgi:hypothetical protein